MRKPTVDEINNAFCIGGAVAVLALLEDKPKPKWEEEFDRFYRMDNKCDDPDMYKDFIRKKLREMYEDCKETNSCRSIVDVKAKWGL